jgi:hypothetical protein
MIASPLPMSNVVGKQNDFAGQFAASRAQSVEHGVPTVGVSKKDNSRFTFISPCQTKSFFKIFFPLKGILSSVGHYSFFASAQQEA